MPDIVIRRDGMILRDGEPFGYVTKVEGLALKMGRWRAECGDPRIPASYRVVYAKTRDSAVRGLVDA